MTIRVSEDAAELREIADAVARQAEAQTLLSLGIDVANPLQAQRDFMVLREVGQLVMDSEFRKDMEYLRTWRLAIQEVKTKGLVTIVGIVVTGLVALVVAGFKGWVRMP